MTRTRTLGTRVARLERTATGATCPCGASTVHDTIAVVMRLAEGVPPAGGEDVCAHCGGALPKIPFTWLQRLLVEEDSGVPR